MRGAGEREGHAADGGARLLDLVTDAVIVRDLATQVVRYWNRGASALYGWEPWEVIERQCEPLLLTEYPHPLGGILMTLGEAGRWQGELRQRARDGTTLTVASRWALRRDERGVAIVQIDRDITVQRRAEAEWARSRATREEEARRRGELAALKADFAAMVAHELLNPLAALGRLTDALATGVLAPELHSAMLASMREEIGALHRLVGDVRATATAERDAFMVRPQPTALAAIVADARGLAATTLGAHPLTVEVFAPANLVVMADRRRIGQVLRNLLGNGAKFSPPGAPLTLRAALRDGDERVTMAVIDRGRGIHPDDLGRIVEKFGRGRDVASGRVSGTGLGLYLSRQILLEHGSELTVESTVGEGSTFGFTLDRAR